MITLLVAEKFVKSKLALCIGFVVVIVWLLDDRGDLQIELIKKENTCDLKLQKKDSIIAVRDKMIYERDQQSKITADNTTQAEKQRAEKYERLYNQVMEIKAAAQQKNIIK